MSYFALIIGLCQTEGHSKDGLLRLTKKTSYLEANDMSDYAHPEVLVSTEWVAAHANDPDIVFVEVNVDTALYDQGHLPGAVGWS